MDYTSIGLRIRLFRRKKGYSQEELAEKVDISVTHMSHIETGNTKLSLPVFISLAEALGVRADELLQDPAPDHSGVIREMTGLLSACSPAQARCILDIAKAAKAAMDQHL